MNQTQKIKRVAFVSVVHPLHDHRFLYKQCKGLSDNDFEVEYYVQADEPAVINNIIIRPLKERNHRFSRFLSTWGLLMPLWKGRYDVIHLVDPELLPLGILLKLITRSAVLFDAHEDYVDFLKHKYYLNAFFARLFSWGMKGLLALSARILDGMVFADSGTADTINMPAMRKGFFHNFPMLSLFPQEPRPWTTRSYDVVYLGTMSTTSGVFIMLEAIARLSQKRSDLRCLFIGEPGGYMKKQVDLFITKYHLENHIEFTGRIPHGQVPGYLQNCKVGLIGLTNLPKFHKNIATKMFEYMASGIPIVSSDLPPERMFMTHGRQCLFVPPEDPNAMADAIDSLLSNPEMAVEMANNCRSHIIQNGYYAEKEIEKLVEYYHYILSNRRRLFCAN